MGSTTDVSLNSGYLLRKQLFMSDNNSAYKTFPVHFVARLNTDFMGATNSLLVPGVEVRIDLTLNPPAVYMMSNTAEGSDSKYGHILNTYFL